MYMYVVEMGDLSRCIGMLLRWEDLSRCIGMLLRSL